MNLFSPKSSRANRRTATGVDPLFYGKYYADLREHSTGALQQHYEVYGEKEGRFPTLKALRKSLTEAGQVLPEDFDARVYKELNGDVEGLDEIWQIEVHFLQHGQRAGRIYKRGPELMADLAIELRENGDIAGSAEITTWLCKAHPELPFGWREAAALGKLAGDKAGTLQLLKRALEVENDVLSVTQIVRHMGGMGLAADAREHVKNFEPRTSGEKEWAALLDQLMQFMIEYPLERARQLVADIIDTPRFLRNEEPIEEMIMTALASGTSFSLIRLGDGEGAWLTDLGDDGGRYDDLYRRNRQEILWTWYGSDAFLDRPDFHSLVPRLKAAIAGATIVGIPYPKRIDWEYEVTSLDGLPSCVMLLRFATSMIANPAALFCSHDVHFGLQLSGALERVLEHRCRVGLICCHPDLAMRLHERYGVEVVANLCLPEEKGMSEIIGSNGTRLPHFPDVYERNVEKIRANDWTSTLWLVAAGFLGKIYCDEIRLNGGIALDIGSLADGWMGKKTRPTLAKEIWSYQLQPGEAGLSAPAGSL